MNRLFSSVFVYRALLVCPLLIFCLLPPFMSSTRASDLHPRILQVLSDPQGRLFVLTDAESGLFLSTDQGKRWRQPPEVPETEFYRLSIGPRQTLYLAGKSGLFRSNSLGSTWEKLSSRPFAFVDFSPQGTTSLLRLWGDGLFWASAASLVHDSHDALTARETIAELKHRIRRKALELVQYRSSLQRELDIQPSMDGMPRLNLDQNKVERLLKALKPRQDELHALRKKAEQLTQELENEPTQAEGLPRTGVQRVSYRSENDIFAAVFGHGVYRSLDAGRSWQACNEGLHNKDVLTVQARPGGAVFAGTYGGGLFRWSAEKSAWSPIATGLERGIVQSLALAPPAIVLAGTQGEGLLLSKDNGTSWKQAALPQAGASVHGISVNNNGSYWAGCYEKGLFVSTDHGRTWEPRALAHLSNVSKLMVDPNNIYYAAVKGRGLLRSSDAGRHWVQLTLPFDERATFTLRGGQILTASANHGPFISSDGGLTWKELGQGLPAKGLRSLHSVGDVSILATTTDGIGSYRLTDANIWQRIEAHDSSEYSAWDVMAVPGGRVIIYGLNDILVSKDGRKPWSRQRFGQYFKNIWVDPSGTVWTERMLSTFAFSSRDGNWHLRNDIPEVGYTRFASLGGSKVVGLRRGKGVDVLRWTGSRLEILEQCLGNKAAKTVAVGKNQEILVGTEQGVWTSSDLGQTWSQIELYK